MSCQIIQLNQWKGALKPHDIPPLTWHTLCPDVFFFKQQTFICVADYYSKFPVVCELHNQTDEEMIHIFAEIVGEYGFHKRIAMQDAGLKFVSSEFKAFCSALDIKTVFKSSYHHATNGQVEWCIQIIKHIFKKCSMGNHNFSLALLPMCTCPHVLNLAPLAELLGRNMQGILPHINHKSDLVTGCDDNQVKKILQQCQMTMKCNC